MPKRPPRHRPAWQPSPEAVRLQQNREHDARRRNASPWRAWYGTARWRKVRETQLKAHPYCVMCEAEGRLTRATVCDHITPHRGDEYRFWFGPYQSLCPSCHSRGKQRIEARQGIA